MSSKSSEVGKERNGFWRDFPAMADYFSPAIVPLLAHLGIPTKQVMHDLGEMVGRTAAAKLPGMTVKQMLDEFAALWERYEIGRLTVVRTAPLALQVSDCTVCGQLPGSGEMYECAFHEGFFRGALSAKTGRPVNMKQQATFEGEAGTWCRLLETDVLV
jgi:predicted hydrocarbon binding protein